MANVRRGTTHAAAALLGLLPLSACIKADKIAEPFSDNFERAAIGRSYHNTGGPYRVERGTLIVKEAYNHPLWLRKQLPRDALIEFDVTSKSDSGDIKVEAWGDGQSHATTRGAYLATSYVFVLGGWGNRISALCRMDEHAPDRIQRTDFRVIKNRKYRFKIRRQGRKVEWFIDGKPFLSLDDANPLEGERHSYFGFNNWTSELHFDDLKITPLATKTGG